MIMRQPNERERGRHLWPPGTQGPGNYLHSTKSKSKQVVITKPY